MCGCGLFLSSQPPTSVLSRPHGSLLLSPVTAPMLHTHVLCVQSATYICEYQDYMNYHLTGRMAASISNVSVRWHYNSTRGRAVTLQPAERWVWVRHAAACLLFPGHVRDIVSMQLTMKCICAHAEVQPSPGGMPSVHRVCMPHSPFIVSEALPVPCSNTCCFTCMQTQ